MQVVTYVREAITPGGTPQRYLVWVSIILFCQVLASVLPSSKFYEPTLNLSHFVLGVTVLIIIIANLAQTDRQKILSAYGMYIVGLILTTITIATGITSLSGIVFMLTWAMTLFIAERREYISFDLVTLFMVLMLIGTVILLMFNPPMEVNENWIILAAGGVLTAVDIYLVYTDFGYDKNYYQEYRRRYADLQILSSKLSEILSSEGKIENLLWKVAEQCVPFLGLEECVIYLYDEDKDRLVQVAAYGDKSNKNHQIIDPIEIKPGEGIVGKVYASGKYIVIKETKNNPDYIVDDAIRNSELAVPILSNGEVIGVIDTEHSVKGFFLERHVQAFQVIASFCGIKIAEYKAIDSIIQAEKLQVEAEHYRELSELKNRFITNISHDLKTPLSLIKGPAIQIEKETEDPKIRKYANYILKNTEHLSRVVGQLLQLNRVDKGLNELYLEEVEVGELITIVGSQYTGLAEKNNIEFDCSADAISLITDKFRLEQIMHNLVHNAFRYTANGGKIKLQGKLSGDNLIITVSDNGAGIPKPIQNKVFDRFFKVDENNHEGTGIGLSLVKEYTDSLKGEVQLESQENKGTTFTVKIPVTPAKEFDSANMQVSNLAGETNDGKPVLMVVEDHADLNDFICSTFEDEYLCVPAFDGEEALKKMKLNTPDLIISDLMMPKMNGNQFVQQVKNSDIFGHIPIIILSAKTQVDSRVDLYTIGADNYLVKPFDVNELKAVVNNVMVRRKKLLETFRSKFLVTEDSDEHTPIHTDSSVAQNTIVGEAIEVVMENLDNSSLNVKLLTDQLSIGRNKLQKEMKEATGLTPVEFIRSIRLNEARRMLEDNTLNVSEVAYSVGFSNLSYFTRSFKNEFDVLPSEYQNK